MAGKNLLALAFFVFIFLTPQLAKSYEVDSYFCAVDAAPDLAEKIKAGVIEKPYPMRFAESLRQKELNKPEKFEFSKLKLKSGPSSSPGSSASAEDIFQSYSAVSTARIFKTLVILADFSDKSALVSSDSFDSLIFSDGNASFNSMKKVYLENSYGQFEVTAVILPSQLGWRRAPSSYAYYVNGAYGLGGYPQNTQKLTEDLVDQIDPLVNFSEFDNDGNGYVDGILIVHAGPGAEFTGRTSDIWSHKWGISPRLKDGVRVSAYSIQPEFWSKPGDITVGVYAHEFGHLLGLPDLYDTDGSSRGLGKWSLMAGGSWNGQLGNSPAHLDAWSKIKVGFVAPQAISSSAAISIPAVQASPSIFKIVSPTLASTEYFLIENRQKMGTDAALPGSGLLIYHIDDTKGSNTQEWYPGLSASNHYWVALEQADGLWELEKNIDYGDANDPFPGGLLKYSFGPASTPDSRGYSGTDSRILVDSISPSGPVMTASITINSISVSPSPSPSVAPTPSVNPNSCTDSDGGLNYGVTGTVSGFWNGNPFSYTDFCSLKVLSEWWCPGGAPGFSNYTCPYDCLDGRCIAAPSISPSPSVAPSPIPDSCSDTEGNGGNGFVSGTVYGYFNSIYYSFSDHCINSNTAVNEYYCSNKYAANTTIGCYYGCANGACFNGPSPSPTPSPLPSASPQATIGPQIFGVGASGITQTSAVISWSTDTPSDSLVRYGTRRGVYQWSISVPSLVTSHVVQLSGLSAGKTYYYVAQSCASAKCAISAEYSFKTQKRSGRTGGAILVEIDDLRDKISEMSIASSDLEQAEILASQAEELALAGDEAAAQSALENSKRLYDRARAKLTSGQLSNNWVWLFGILAFVAVLVYVLSRSGAKSKRKSR